MGWPLYIAGLSPSSSLRNLLKLTLAFPLRIITLKRNDNMGKVSSFLLSLSLLTRFSFFFWAKNFPLLVLLLLLGFSVSFSEVSFFRIWCRWHLCFLFLTCKSVRVSLFVSLSRRKTEKEVFFFLRMGLIKKEALWVCGVFESFGF